MNGSNVDQIWGWTYIYKNVLHREFYIKTVKWIAIAYANIYFFTLNFSKLLK